MGYFSLRNGYAGQMRSIFEREGNTENIECIRNQEAIDDTILETHLGVDELVAVEM